MALINGIIPACFHLISRVGAQLDISTSPFCCQSGLKASGLHQTETTLTQWESARLIPASRRAATNPHGVMDISLQGATNHRGSPRRRMETARNYNTTPLNIHEMVLLAIFRCLHKTHICVKDNAYHEHIGYARCTLICMCVYGCI